VLKEIADAHGATPRQVAPVIVQRSSLFTIPIALTSERADNVGAGALQLAAAELAGIHAAFPLGPRPSTFPVL
jgi:diketogulonate reductase-like aldo/keto reductase